MSDLIIFFVSNIFNIVLFWIFCNWCMKKETINFIPLILMFLLLLIKRIGTQYHQPLLNLINSFAIYIFIIWKHRAKWRMKYFVLVIFLIASIISEELSAILVQVIMKTTFENTNMTLIIVLSKVFLFSFAYIISILLKAVSNDDISYKNMFIMLLFPCSSLAILIIVRYPIVVGDVNIGHLFGFILLSIANLACCYEFSKVAFDAKKSKENMILLKKQQSDADYYHLLLQKYEGEHILLHDEKKYLRYMIELLETKKYEEVKSYAYSYIEKMEKGNIVLTGNKSFDIVLSGWEFKIKESNIKIDLTGVQKVDLSYISEIDKCAIFGNVIENAIESCMKCKERYIRFLLREIDHNRIIFKVINSCNMVTRDTNENYKTTKLDDSNHGYGLKSIALNAKKNNAIMVTDFDEINHEYITILYFQK